jgi:hypothetical protein
VARLWGTDPVTLLGATKADYDAMVGVLTEQLDPAAPTGED